MCQNCITIRLFKYRQLTSLQTSSVGCNPDSVSVLAHIYNLSTKNILMAQRDIRVTVSKIETALKFQESVRRIAVSSFKTFLFVFPVKTFMVLVGQGAETGLPTAQ